ncbi:MAG: MBL fold metallo-hydrolase [Candidatus Scalindua sp.]|jgi:flavorubredoxin|nr:MBL fold metallo-hydrolase [Candidatus Scalindua sp.]MBT6560985.1 MBL fold metallo-hydrolase [Candidatus Scalindua sp.]
MDNNTDTYDETMAHNIVDGIYWVGFADRKAGFSNNPYVLDDGEDVILFDPGSRAPEHFNIVKDKVCSVVEPERINYIVAHHQDPDLCAAIPLFEEIVDPRVKIITPTRAAPFMRYYDSVSEVIPVEDGEMLSLKSGRTLTFVHTPYVHFAGSMVTYDAKTKTVFSSDIFGAFSIDWNLYANENYIEAFKAFTEPYLASKDALDSALDKLETIEIERICPQHGSIIDNDIGKYLQAARELEVGTWV